MSSFYTAEELRGIGFRRFGTNVLISRNAGIYGAHAMEIGDNVRVDDFCILSGKISFGNYIHIAAGTYVFAGEAGVVFSDYSGASSRCSIYAVTDDYSGEFMSNPMVPARLRNVQSGEVHFGRHALVGAGSIVLPGVTIGEGAAVGAMSLVTRSLEPFGIYAGVPARRIKERSRRLLELQKELEARQN